MKNVLLFHLDLGDSSVNIISCGGWFVVALDTAAAETSSGSERAREIKQ